MSPQAGGSIGRKLAEVLAEATVKARAATAPGEAAVRERSTRSQMERMEREAAGIARQLLGRVLEDPETPEAAREMLRQLTEPTNQVNLILQILTLPFLVGTAAAASNANMIDELTAWSRGGDPQVPLTAEQAATGFVKGVLSEGKGRSEAAKAGTNEERFGLLAQITGNPPGPQDLLEMWRRGIIDVDDVERGIRQGITKNEWIPALKAMRTRHLGAGAAIAAAVQGALSDGDSRRFWFEDGFDPDDWQAAYDTAGNPPGIEALGELVNRGLVSEKDFEQAIRESAYKNKYIPALKLLRTRIPPQDTVRMMLSKGVIDRPTALRKLFDLGFDPDDAARIVALATTEKTAPERDLARGQVVQGYVDRLLDRPAALRALENLGYDPGEAEFLLDLADHARERRFTEAAIARIHTIYRSRRLDRSQAGTTLDRLGVPAAQRNDLIALWDLERDADVPEFSLAQLQGLFRRGALSEEEFTRRVRDKGWPAEDVQFLMLLSFPPGGGG